MTLLRGGRATDVTQADEADANGGMNGTDILERGPAPLD
jgi:hypothetical protein